MDGQWRSLDRQWTKLEGQWANPKHSNLDQPGKYMYMYTVLKCTLDESGFKGTLALEELMCILSFQSISSVIIHYYELLLII